LEISISKLYPHWKCDDLTYRRPEIFYVLGKASWAVAPTLGYITIGISVTDMDAAIALK
jgi:hypothetical protein